MIDKSWRQWLPLLWAVLAASLLMSWAVYAEGDVQGPIYLPGGFAFQAYLPSHYCIYCPMKDDLSNKAAILSKMRVFPEIACEVKGAGHLNVLEIKVWRAGGRTRFIKDAASGKMIMLMPFAEFEILWPGNYELRAGFISDNHPEFLMCVGPTGLVGSAGILSIVILIVGFIFMFQKKREISTAKESSSVGDIELVEEVAANED